MKVFLSWSGDLSHKTALIFRDWLPSVIQSIVPYVSSEDIDKGARWSTDIAKELEDSTYGILCVTKENVHAPWLTFEAGALSKTMEKSSVSPFLFDIKRSEVSGPILQFQSTIFEKEDLKKLVSSLNKACGADNLSEERLEKAFSVWYPTLESQLNNLLSTKPNAPVVDPENEAINSSAEILEEILDLTRSNQKLLRNPEGELVKEFDSIKSGIERIAKKISADEESRGLRRSRKMRPMVVDELLNISPRLDKNFTGFQIAVSLFRDDFPWLYDAGIDLVRVLKGKSSVQEKDSAASAFFELVDFTFQHPMMRDFYMPDKEFWLMGKEIPHILRRSLARHLSV